MCGNALYLKGMIIDRFILFLFLSIVAAYFFPQLALHGDGNTLETISTVGVSFIFFFYGLKLSLTDIKNGLRNWRLHLVVQCITFVLFPAMLLLLRPLVGRGIDENLWLSFFFLAALPSTVSSSVVMVSLAKGNVPAAIFNASISGLIGVLITPLWMSFFLVFRTENVFVDVYVGLFTEIILPVMLGLLLQRYAGKWARKHSKALSTFDRLVILLIVYGSFAHSFADGIFGEVGYKHLVFVAMGVVVLFILVYWLTHLVSKLLGFSREDEITALFCGSKKSLTHGSVFGKFLFVNNPYAGLYFLPIMLYHAFQILVISVIANNMQKKADL